MDKIKYKVRDWILEQPQKGKITFSMDEVHSQFPSLNRNTVASAIRRLVEGRKIQSVWHGFYVIVPVEYELKGVVPPMVYIDRLMNFLQRDYYIGLLNAAAFYGAAHQQPQVFTVVTDKKNFRDKHKNGVTINFVSKKEIPHPLVRKITTKTGFVSVSSPELTAVDLVLYQTETGGLSRAGTVLNELIEEMDFSHVPDDFFRTVSTPTIQRLGYILDRILENSSMADALLSKAQEAGVKFRNTLLKSGNKTNGEYACNAKWKVIINEEIEIDE